MLERQLHALSLADAGAEDLAATRERLKDRFPRGATRRMTQLGLLLGAALDDLAPQPGDTIVYASSFAETGALEGYLDSFPTASPTLFQTSIHPSAVQQALIARQHAVGEFFPLTGRAHLAAQALQTALLAPAPRVILCGGEERGTWLLAHRAASDRTFAFALALSRDPAGSLARVTLAPAADDTANAEFTLPDFFDALRARQPIDQLAAPGRRLGVAWI
ncbi:MAG: hypothetical protein Q8N18_16150 [Opitutaceae bacterium]|nr:hypothetical protein [Opitutaceae bacterium]